MNKTICSAALFTLVAFTVACGSESDESSGSSGKTGCASTDSANADSSSKPSAPKASPAEEKPEQPGGSDTSTPPSKPCDMTLKVDAWRDASYNVSPGDTDLSMLHLRLTAPMCKSIQVESLDLRMTAPIYPPNNVRPICAQWPCLGESEFVFQNWKVKEKNAQSVLATSFNSISSLTVQAPVVTLNSSFKMDPGQVVELEVTADLNVNSTAPWHDVAFRATLDVVRAGTKLDITDPAVFQGTTSEVIWVTPPNSK